MSAGPTDDRLSQLATRWTLLLQAHQGDAAQAREAQAELLPRYCTAIARYLVRLVGDADVADDLCQEFAVKFLRGDFRHARPERGRFRDYVKAAVIHLVGAYRRRLARGPAQPLTPAAADHLFTESPDAAPELTDLWRAELINRTWEELSRWSAANGRLYYDVLRRRADDSGVTSARLAEDLAARCGREFTADGVRQLLRRAREQFAELLWREVAASLPSEDAAAIEAELAELSLLAYCQPFLARRS